MICDGQAKKKRFMVDRILTVRSFQGEESRHSDLPVTALPRSTKEMSMED